MASEGKEGVTYSAGEWDHGQLGLPVARKFVVDAKEVEFDMEVPSSGQRTIGKNHNLPPIPAVDDKEAVSQPWVVPFLRKHHVVHVAAGGDHSIAVTDAGRVFAFGKNDCYQLGVTAGAPTNLSATSRLGTGKVQQEGADERVVGPEPVQVVSLRWKRVLQVACGDSHSLARSAEGLVYAWGMGNSGRLGQGNFKSLPQPTKVAALDEHRVVYVAAGYYHSLAILEDGNVMTWGGGDAGQLGTGKFESSCLPVPLDMRTLNKDETVTFSTVHGGEYFSAAVSSNGRLYTWGMNNSGQLGLGHTDRRCSPVHVAKHVSNKVLELSLGPTFGVAVLDNTETVAWGSNLHGQLGLGHRDEKHEPMVIESLRGVHLDTVSCGGRHVAALDKKQRLWVWGYNTSGALCVGDTMDRLAPVPVENSQDLVLAHVACGYGHTLLLSAHEPSEVQSRSFYTSGMITMNDPVEKKFCLYGGSQGGKYQPLSVIRQFFNRHGIPLSPDPVFIVDTASDRRLLDMMDRIRMLASAAEDRVEQVRIVAVCVFYEMGGAHPDLNLAASRHIANLTQRLDEKSGIVPLSAVRVGDSRHRAILCKLVCDRLGIPCALLRGSIPVDPVTGEYSVPVQDPATHHWNIVMGEKEGSCHVVDCCTAPSHLGYIEDDPVLVRSLSTSDRDLP